MSDKRKYEEAEPPKGTPPQISNAAKANARGEDEHESAEKDKATTKANQKLSRKLDRKNKRDGAGERELDSMKPETLLPPD